MIGVCQLGAAQVRVHSKELDARASTNIQCMLRSKDPLKREKSWNCFKEVGSPEGCNVWGWFVNAS